MFPNTALGAFFSLLSDLKGNWIFMLEYNLEFERIRIIGVIR